MPPAFQMPRAAGTMLAVCGARTTTRSPRRSPCRMSSLANREARDSSSLKVKDNSPSETAWRRSLICSCGCNRSAREVRATSDMEKLHQIVVDIEFCHSTAKKRGDANVIPSSPHHQIPCVLLIGIIRQAVGTKSEHQKRQT